MHTRSSKTTIVAIVLILIAALGFSLVFSGSYSRPALANQNAGPSTQDLRAGKNYIPTKVYSVQDDEQILKFFESLRVADVSDGMDKVGLTNTGLMSPEIHALWKDTVHYKHRFIGIAVTVRYVPTNKPPASAMETGPFDRWVGQWYNQLSSEPFVPLIRKGTALVIDDAPDSDVGSIGSNNIMGWQVHGCVGVVTNATARDTDEIITEKVPLYFRKPGRGIRPGRNEIESVNRPIVCGGVLVEPGDVIVADGDGVIVVPRAHAKEVAEYAKAILDGDKAGRRNLYKKLGLPPDDSVK
ncbi:MAG TPA: dimethylmenaquinone methyltransferase [Phycisphaerales bacterium]|nr:dimethylmenaquinone methyltransferase [Phycisphaerales bacterium]